jgi:hypothetical protein
MTPKREYRLYKRMTPLEEKGSQEKGKKVREFGKGRLWTFIYQAGKDFGQLGLACGRKKR